MQSLLEYVKSAKTALENYTTDNGLDDLAMKAYKDIQNIGFMKDEDRDFLNKFIMNYGDLEKHLADVTYAGGDMNAFFARMRPVKLSKDNGGIYQAKGSSLNFVLQGNRGSVKVYQKVKGNLS